MTDGDLSIAEKRVYGDRTGATEAFVGSGVGLVRVKVSGDLVGEFDLCRRGTVHDVTAGGGSVVVAGEEDVEIAPDGESFAGTEFGPAAAVGVHDGRVVAARTDGEVARLVDGEWETLGWVDDPRAVDGGLVAAADGVYRVVEGALSHAGLEDVRDVAGRGVPLAATTEGLYTLGNGWMDVADGGFRVVDSDGERAYAVDDQGAVLARASPGAEWTSVDDLTADTPVVGSAFGPDQVIAVTADGRVFATVGDGWRSQLIGVGGVTGVAVR